MDLTGLQVFFKECIQFLLFRRCQWIDFTISRFFSRNQFNSMVPLLVFREGVEGFLRKDICR
jgi:hypothetical protein